MCAHTHIYTQVKTGRAILSGAFLAARSSAVFGGQSLEDYTFNRSFHLWPLKQPTLIFQSTVLLFVKSGEVCSVLKRTPSYSGPSFHTQSDQNVESRECWFINKVVGFLLKCTAKLQISSNLQCKKFANNLGNTFL